MLCKATHLLRILNDEDFNFWLTVFLEIILNINIFYNHLQHRNANSGSICNAVNTFLEVINRERNKLPSASLQQENAPPAKRRKGSIRNLVSAKEVVTAHPHTTTYSPVLQSDVDKCRVMVR